MSVWICRELDPVGSPAMIRIGGVGMMNLDQFPLWLMVVLTFVAVALAIEAGYRLGTAAHRRSDDEKESPVSAIAGTILGLLAFMLAFTFGIVSNRFDDRKGLVREEANAIRTAFARSDFLP